MSVDGTKSRNPWVPEKKLTTATDPPVENSARINEATQSVGPKMSRRGWFSAIVPAVGEGLVQLLRESNHFQETVSEGLREKTRELVSEKEDPSSR